MKTPRVRRKTTHTETLVMTGGLNTIVSDLELKKGEMHQCVNYMEMDGDYHGYSSILGYERYDGKTSPSSIGAPQLNDFGNDDDTVLLLESLSFNDVSSTQHQVINEGTSINTGVYKFFETSFESPATGYLTVRSHDTGEFDESFDESFYSIDSDGASKLNLGESWNIDLQLRPKVRIDTQIIFEKPNCYKLEITTDNKLVFWISSAGTIYDYSLSMTEEELSTRIFSHISISCKSHTIRMAINGTPIVDASNNIKSTTVPSISQTLGDLTIGSTYNGYFDEFRISSTYRWIDEFAPPIERYSTEDYTPQINWDDEDREAQRLLIEEVPGTGSLLGVHIYNGEVYALRNKDGVNAALYVADETGDDLTAGWVLVDDTLTANGVLMAVNYRWSGVFSSKEVMVIVDGVSLPRVWDGTTMTLFDNAEASTIPDRDTTPRYAKNVAIFDKRVLLAYEADDIVLSSKSDPRDFSAGFGEQLIIGDDIQDLRELPGENMAIICRNSIKVLTKLQDATADYTFRVDDFTRQSGGIGNTCERLLEFVLYADDRGIVSMTDTDTYGDFSAAAISKKVNRIYLSKKEFITTSITDKRRNQYRIFFSDGSGLIFTFTAEELKGATYFEYPNPVIYATTGKDSTGTEVKYFTTNSDAYVRRMDSGTSFDGTEIYTELFTAFYHYRYVRHWKRFLRMIFEITASRGTVFNVRNVFDYDSIDFPETLWWTPNLKGLGGIWGEDNWGEFTWGGAAIQRMVNYIRGYGTNMSIEVITLSKYNNQHTIHNVIVDYELGNLQE